MLRLLVAQVDEVDNADEPLLTDKGRMLLSVPVGRSIDESGTSALGFGTSSCFLLPEHPSRFDF